MSPNEPNDRPDLSDLPDLAELDLNSQTNGADMDIPDLPDLPELPELEVMTEATPSGAVSDADDLPELPELPELPDLPELVDLPPVAKPRSSAAKPGAKAAPAPKQRKSKPAAAPVSKAKRKIVAPKKAAKKVEAPKPVESPAEIEPLLETPAPTPEPAAPKPAIEPITTAEADAEPAIAAVEASADSNASEANEVETKVAATADTPEAASADPATASGTTGGGPAGAPDPNRAPDAAPLQLRKAAWIVVVGSLFPWMGAEAGLIGAGASKVVVCLGAWILYECVLHGAGQKASGLIVKLASVKFGTPSDKRNKSFPEKLAGVLPSLGHLIGLVVLLAGVFITVQDPNLAGGKGDIVKALAEVGMLAWAASTLVHIRAFIHGGKFNPIFPLMFIGMVLAGLMSLISAFGTEDTMMMASGVLGSLCVSAGGFYACYTIFEAMKQAKNEGEAKKAAQREARKKARGDGGGKGGKKGSKRAGAVVRKRAADRDA